MGFMGLGPAELVIILVIALVVFGPGKLPEMGNSLGKSIREFRKATSEVMEPLNEVKQSVNEMKPLPTTLLTGSPANNGSVGTESSGTARPETGASDRAEAATPAHANAGKLCASCSAQNPSSSEFCGTCGKPLA
jgi:sec-independent protein translocase protein TatA